MPYQVDIGFGTSSFRWAAWGKFRFSLISGAANCFRMPDGSFLDVNGPMRRFLNVANRYIKRCENH